mgnify:FL=1
MKDYQTRLWIDTRGEPVVTRHPNGVRNARRWGWTPAVASAVSEGDIARIVENVIEGDWLAPDPVAALWAEVSGENRRREDAAVAAFKAAWHVADEMGDTGNRVRRGLRAALDTIENYQPGKDVDR